VPEVTEPVSEPPEPDLFGFNIFSSMMKEFMPLFLAFIFGCKTAVLFLFAASFLPIYPKKIIPVLVTSKRVKDKVRCP
jgi:hypothetical protein